MVALQSKKSTGRKGTLPLYQRGFPPGKKPRSHYESSSCHRDAIQMIVELPKTCPDVGEMLSTEHAAENAQNRECLLI